MKILPNDEHFDNDDYLQNEVIKSCYTVISAWLIIETSFKSAIKDRHSEKIQIKNVICLLYF